eukprot:CAMPEP_0172414728 /NCGR_PEP_ID=MMETSP1064-20121228/1366_1 /TAXON_ID=202472 /ORGANISM="Aulacoseira subarctica , Strain CCAP 1002/5" /LENGTH=71 /DNA_ID=CAMNT_0013151533 /DNA_START=24 /DNA_END=239 /DNA_ORIENTATION=+
MNVSFRALRGGPIVILGVTSACTIGTIAYSHYAQVKEKKEMRAGVERDKQYLKEKRKMQRDAAKQQQQSEG